VNGASVLQERKPRNFIVFINPMSGIQRGESLFKRCVKPMFDVAEIEYKVIVTGRLPVHTS